MKLAVLEKKITLFKNTVAIAVMLLFATATSYSQCTYTGNPLTQVGTDYTFCIDNTNSFTTPSVKAGQYVVVNVVKGFSYTFSVGNVFNGGNNENLTVFDNSNNLLTGVYASGSNGATISNWTAPFSGKIKILLSKGSCVNDNSNGGALTLTLNSIGNTQDSQTTFGTDQWVGHVYNWTGAAPPGGTSPTAVSTTTTPFTNANYVGYYNVGAESISEGFGGNTNCFPVLTAGVNSTNIYTETFAVRYRMRSTKIGCYFLSVSGDDGIRVYVDNVLVFDAWKEQSQTTYCNNLIYLNGSSDIVFDYYENGGENVANFSLTAFIPSTNTISGAAILNVCSGVSPGLLDGSAYLPCATSSISNVKFQWQVSTDNVTFTDIPGATSEDYTPAAITTTTNVVRYYRRVLKASPSNAGSCEFNTNVIRVNTSASAVLGTVGAISGTTPQCPSLIGQVYSVTAVTNALNYVWTVPTGWTITDGQGTNSITVTTGASGQNGNISVTASNGCTTSPIKTLAVTVGAASVGGSVTGGTTICSNATSGLLTLAGHTGTVIRWESAVSPFSTWTPIANTTTTYTSGVLTQTTKFRAVVQNGVCNAANSSDTQVSFQSTTWDGASWLNGLPNSATQVIFNGSYTPTSDAALVASATPLVLSACSVVIQSGVVTFPADYVLNVANTVDSTLGGLIFENGASLVQSNDVINSVGDYSGGNVGNIVYRRTTTKVGLYDYTYWSTPVWPQLLTTMSPDSPNNYYFYFNPILANWVNINSNNLMDVGKGYIIRAPYYADNTTGYTSNFMGVPNSGTITTPIQIGPTTATPIYREMNLIGNPYPSALSALSFLSNSLNTNVVDATMYFWTHNTPITSNVYNADDYAMFNYSGSVSSTPATATGNNNAAPNGYVASGQSFFIKGINSGGMATFQNNMRGTALTNGQFYRSSTPATPTLENEIIDLERNRFWLDIFNTGGAFKQMMVGYIEQATNAFDRGFDGLTFNSGNVINFYSLINPTTLLGIQGRALPFLTSDVVPLGYSTTINGTFQIQLSNYDAFFNTQNIYLKDKLLNNTHNLKLGNYTFETNAGTFNDRFEIVYENPLQTDNFKDTAVVVYKANDLLNIKATNKNISKVDVYDIRGRLLITKTNLTTSEIALDLGTVNQVVLVQITTDDGIVITKKYIN